MSLLTKLKDIIVNKNQVDGAVKEVAGKVQKEVGKLVGSNQQQAQGVSKQISGKAEKAYGEAKEAVKDATGV
jgi:uncharacterized protein YjbJ (UPF0337 family)